MIDGGGVRHQSYIKDVGIAQGIEDVEGLSMKH